jgi:cell division septation protein DedD
MTDTVPGTPIPPPPPQPPNVSADLYKAVIGPVNQAGYLRHFAQFDAQGKTGPTWHWAAFLSALNWLLFRGMWGTALLYVTGMLAALLGLLGIGKLAYDFSDPTALLLLAGLIGLSSVLAGLYAHAVYYRFCKKQIVLTVGLASSMQDARKRLLDQASTSRRLYVLVGLNTALLCALLWGSALIQQAGLVHTRPDTPEEPPPLPVVDASAPALVPALVPASAPVAIASMPASTPVSEPASAPVSAPAPVVVPPKPAVAKPVAAAASSPVTTRYFVQVGVFAVENNALTLQEKLEAAGFRVHTLGLNTPKGVLIQVRVGPFGTKPEADDIALQLRAMDLPTYVFKFQPGVTP